MHWTMPSANIPEEEFTPASLFEPSCRTSTAATVTTTKATLLSCSTMALPTVISSQNGDTANATESTSNTTNSSASSSVSNVKNALATPKKDVIKEMKNKIFGPPYLG
jgi:hypothetical protein